MDKKKAQTTGILAMSRMASELDILQKISHPNIICFVVSWFYYRLKCKSVKLMQQFTSLQDHVDTPEKLFLVLELAHVGELFDIINKEPFTEKIAKFYFYQMATAVEYLHSQVCKQWSLWNTHNVIHIFLFA